jgi:hypothetical protein
MSSCPAPIEVYIVHYRQCAREGVIWPEQTRALANQLAAVHEAGALTQLDGTGVDKGSSYLRNTAVLDAADRLVAFQMNGSAGTRDTIDKARERGMPVELHEYAVEMGA